MDIKTQVCTLLLGFPVKYLVLKSLGQLYSYPAHYYIWGEKIPSFVLLVCNSTYNFYKHHEQWKESLMDLPFPVRSEGRLWMNVFDLLFLKGLVEIWVQAASTIDMPNLTVIYWMSAVQALGCPKIAGKFPHSVHTLALSQRHCTFRCTFQCTCRCSGLAQCGVKRLMFSCTLDLLLCICWCWHFFLTSWKGMEGSSSVPEVSD